MGLKDVMLMDAVLMVFDVLAVERAIRVTWRGKEVMQS
jgi:hypothetical protein